MEKVMDTAHTFRRLVAFAIDSLISGLCLLPVWLQIFASYVDSGVPSVRLSWVVAGLLLQLFYKWLFLYFLGGTLGKLIMGLRVVPRHHPEQSLSLMQSFLRVLTDSLSLFFGQALRALALLRLDRTHVSDWVAETRVVQFTPRRYRPTRHWLGALLIAVLSFWGQFHKMYELVQNSSYDSGEIVFDANY